MANAYNGAQTTQGEVGDFNELYTYFLRVYENSVFQSDITIEGTVNADRLVVENNALVKGRIKTQEVELGTFNAEGDFVPFDPPKLLSELFEEGTGLQDDLDALEDRVSTVETSLGELSGYVNFTVYPQVTSNTSRIIALESASFDASELSNLTDTLAALQTRTGTLESLIGLLTNNNPTDTVVENRITNLETKIDALISVYNSIKAIHNMPINL